jgi:two-component system cell cycle response regulator
VRLLDERDLHARGHGSEVARLSVAVARRLGLPADELDQLAAAAALYDIGKVAVPHAIRDKPGPLSDEDWAFMRTHTLLGERILTAAPALSREALLVGFSHERWDGHGYPDGRAGEAIPLGSRSDAFESMTSPRPYRAALAEAEAVVELRRCAGSRFDPAVVDALSAVLAQRLPLAP